MRFYIFLCLLAMPFVTYGIDMQFLKSAIDDLNVDRVRRVLRENALDIAGKDELLTYAQENLKKMEYEYRFLYRSWPDFKLTLQGAALSSVAGYGLYRSVSILIKAVDDPRINATFPIKFGIGVAGIYSCYIPVIFGLNYLIMGVRKPVASKRLELAQAIVFTITNARLEVAQ